MADQQDRRPAGTPSRASRGRARARADAEHRAMRSRITVYGVVAAGVAIVAGVVVAAVLLTGSGESGTSEAEDFDLPALDGGAEERVRLADYEGTPVVVNFFASWCPTCDTELPDFDRMADELEGRVAFVFVNANEDADWRPMAERTGILDQTLARDVGPDNNGLYEAVGGTVGMPITAFYDEQGEHVKTVFQGLTYDLLDAELRETFGVSA